MLYFALRLVQKTFATLSTHLVLPSFALRLVQKTFGTLSTNQTQIGGKSRRAFCVFPPSGSWRVLTLSSHWLLMIFLRCDWSWRLPWFWSYEIVVNRAEILLMYTGQRRTGILTGKDGYLYKYYKGLFTFLLGLFQRKLKRIFQLNQQHHQQSCLPYPKSKSVEGVRPRRISESKT